MPTVINPSQSLLAFELTQEQVLNIAASLASDLGSAADLMSEDFRERHFQLFELFASNVLTAMSMSRQGVLQ